MADAVTASGRPVAALAAGIGADGSGLLAGHAPGLEGGEPLRHVAVLAGSPLGDAVRQPYQGGQPLRGSCTQLDSHPVPFGQACHREQPHVPGYRFVDGGWII